MDHTQAIELKAVERYLLNELDVPQRDEFEEHAFVCAACAQELRHGFEFRENAIAYFAEHAQQQRQGANTRVAVETVPVVEKPSWAERLRPWFQLPSLVPTLAAVSLFGVVGWQRAELNRTPAFPEAAIATVQLTAQQRGAEQLTALPMARVSRLDVEFVVSKEFTWRLVDDSGKVLNPGGQGKTNEQSRYVALVGPFRHPGRYSLVLKDSTSGLESEYPFEVSAQ